MVNLTQKFIFLVYTNNKIKEKVMIKGKRLKKAREKCNLTEADLGRLVGVSKTAISLYEAEKRNPKIDTLLEIMYTLGVSCDYLLGADVFVKYHDGTIRYEAFSKEEVEFINELRKNKELYAEIINNPTETIEKLKS